MLARFVASLFLLALLANSARADVFDRYINPILAKAPEGPGVKEIKKLTPELIEQHGRLVPDTAGVLLVVKTNAGLNSKLIVTAAGQRVEKKAVPMALIERFVTYKASEDRALQATGQNVHLYGGDDHDSLEGGNQDDFLQGGAGNDAMYGNAGNDTLDPVDDNQDILNGGIGADLFLVDVEGWDWIDDFFASEGDQIFYF
jgi:hemolysin type calcium-binding protein